MQIRSALWKPTLVLFLLLPVISLPGHAAASNVTPPVLTGEYEYGEKYTVVYTPPDEDDGANDNEDFDRYRFQNSWLQWDQSLRPQARVAIRAQQIERDYVDRPTLDNITRYAQVRLTLEPAEDWAVWPHVSVRRRDYDQRLLDNTTLTSGVEARYRWGVRHNVRFGASYITSRYDDDLVRDRDQGAVFGAFERPVNERLTMRVSGRAEATSFAQQAASRENATRGSAAVGFRYEF